MLRAWRRGWETGRKAAFPVPPSTHLPFVWLFPKLKQATLCPQQPHGERFLKIGFSALLNLHHINILNLRKMRVKDVGKPVRAWTEAHRDGGGGNGIFQAL